MSINRFWTPQTLWAKSQTIISKSLLIVTSNPFLQLLIKYLRSFDVFGGLYVDIQWISGTILGQCQHLGMLKYLKIMRNAISNHSYIRVKEIKPFKNHGQQIQSIEKEEKENPNPTSIASPLATNRNVPKHKMEPKRFATGSNQWYHCPINTRFRRPNTQRTHFVRVSHLFHVLRRVYRKRRFLLR